MITAQVASVAELSFEDRELYTQHLRIINKIVCSFSREAAFNEALNETSMADKYSVMADMYVSHNVVYIFDEEGFMNTYYLSEKES